MKIDKIKLRLEKPLIFKTINDTIEVNLRNTNNTELILEDKSCIVCKRNGDMYILFNSEYYNSDDNTFNIESIHNPICDETDGSIIYRNMIIDMVYEYKVCVDNKEVEFYRFILI